MKVLATTEVTTLETYRPVSDELCYGVEYRSPHEGGTWLICTATDELRVAEAAYNFYTQVHVGLLFRLVELDDKPVRAVSVDA